MAAGHAEGVRLSLLAMHRKFKHAYYANPNFRLLLLAQFVRFASRLIRACNFQWLLRRR